MTQIIQQKVQVRNQKFDTANGPLALYKGVSILPGGLRALTPIGGLPDGFIADTDVQGQFSIVFNTDALPFAGAVSGTQYYYDDTVAGGNIITTVGPKPLGIGVSGTTSEETGYILLDYKQQSSKNEILYKVSDYTILPGDKDKIIAFDTTSGLYVATLPLANSVSNGDRVFIRIRKGTNGVNINTSGTDVIDDGLSTTSLLMTDTDRTGIELVSDGVGRWVAVLDYTGKSSGIFGEVTATKLWVSANNGQFTEANVNTGAITNIYTPSSDCNGCFSYTGMSIVTVQHTTPSGYNQFNDATNTFTTIDNTTGNIVPYITKNQLYTLESRSVASSMTVRDINTNTLIATVPLGFTTNFGGDFFTEDNTYYYMSNFNNARLHRINKLSFVVNTITVTTNPMGVIIADGKIYVGSNGTNNISVVDQTSFTLIATITTPAGSRPAYGDYGKNGKVYFANRSGTPFIYVVNTTTNVLLPNVLGTTGSQYVQAGGIQYGNNNRLYVASQGDGSVKVIDTTTDTQIASRPFPAAQGLTLS